MGAHEVVHQPVAAAFIIRILGDTSEQDVVDCLREYEAAVEMHFRHRKFSVVLNVDKAAHGSLAVLRLIRRSLEDQARRDYLVRVVGVSDDASQVAMSRSGGAGILLFGNEDQAVDFLAEQARNEGLV